MAHVQHTLQSKFKRTVLAALTAGTVLASASPVRAGTEVSVSPNGFSTATIEVISEDGKSWTKIKDKDIHFLVTIGIGRTDENVVGYTLRQPGQPGTYLDSYLQTSEFSHQPLPRVDADLIVLGSTTHFTAVEKKEVLDACNAKLGTGGGINQTHNFFHGAKVQLVGFFTSGVPGQINLGGNAGKIGNGTGHVPVVCKGIMARPGGVVAKEPATLSVGSIELFRSTFSNATSQPNPGSVCKKAQWLVRLNTNKAGPVKFKLWTKIGDAPMTSKVIDAWSEFDGPGKFKAEYTEWTEVTKTTVVQAMAEDMTNTFGQSTGWKDITLHCTGAGGGGLADAPRPNNDGGLPPLKVTGELTLADQAGATEKPRQGQAVFKIWASRPGETSYKLTCTGGREWEGTLPTSKVADQKYQAVGAHNFNIDKTEQIGCALRSTSLPKDNVIALATKLFVVRNPHVGGSGKETSGAANPSSAHADPVRPARPDVKVVPMPPQISCAGGKVVNSACFCPAGSTQVHAGLNAYRCMPRTVQPERLAPPIAHRFVQPPAQRSAPADLRRSAPDVPRSGPAQRRPGLSFRF